MGTSPAEIITLLIVATIMIPVSVFIWKEAQDEATEYEAIEEALTEEPPRSLLDTDSYKFNHLDNQI